MRKFQGRLGIETPHVTETLKQRTRLAARFGLIAIRAYQLTLSPLRPNTCRFEPSCSAYGMEAIREHGLLKGSGLTLWRIPALQSMERGRS